MNTIDYIKEALEIKDEEWDEYDDIFGDPTTEVWEIYDFLDFLDDLIEYSNGKRDFVFEAFTESLNKKYNLKVNKIVATTSFEKALKVLTKKHKNEVIKELKNIIIDLGNYEISKQKKNHPLKNMEGHRDIHIDGGNLILMYKYIEDDKLYVWMGTNSTLKLQDLVDHKQLKNYDRRKLNSDTVEFDVDKLN